MQETAGKKMFMIAVLKQIGALQDDLVKACTTYIRPALENAAPGKALIYNNTAEPSTWNIQKKSMPYHTRFTLHWQQLGSRHPEILQPAL